jgi:hypothetical protein
MKKPGELSLVDTLGALGDVGVVHDSLTKTADHIVSSKISKPVLIAYMLGSTYPYFPHSEQKAQ